jgi:hypothetical protein
VNELGEPFEARDRQPGGGQLDGEIRQERHTRYGHPERRFTTEHAQPRRFW